MFKAIRTIQSATGVRTLYIKDEDGLTTDPKRQNDVVTECFKSIFTNEEAVIILHSPTGKVDFLQFFVPLSFI